MDNTHHQLLSGPEEGGTTNNLTHPVMEHGTSNREWTVRYVMVQAEGVNKNGK